MRSLIFTALVIFCSATSQAQQQTVDTAKVIFTPPIIVKDSSDVKFTPPVIKKNKSTKGNKKNIPKVDISNFKPAKKD